MVFPKIFKKKKQKEEPKEKAKGEIEKVPETSPFKEKSKEYIPEDILTSPHISEKATTLAKENQYIFKVTPKTNKIEIKKAIENLYKVNVESVRIIKIPKKRRRLGRITGWRKGYKKAIVKIKEGQKIEILPR